ncbi:MAG: FGGY family carbohydrate kinase [Mediterraneibacter gnavus]
MRTLLGIDIGTSSIKAMMLDIASGKIYVKKRRYSVSIPAPNCAEQNPELWWENLVEIFQEFRSDSRCRKAFESVVGISFSGQMHGLVSIDEYGKPVRPAIIWLDQRSVQEVDEILGKLSEEEINTVSGNRICVGFSCPSLLWIKKMSLKIIKKFGKYFNLRTISDSKMTGEIVTEVTDASASGIYDVKNRRWAKELIRRVGLSGDNFPDCYESGEIAGYVTMKCAELTGLKEGIPVLYGCGDQMAQSIGNGVYQEGKLISNIGTGGQVSAYSNEFVSDRRLRTKIRHLATPLEKAILHLSCGRQVDNSLNWLCNKKFIVKKISLKNTLKRQNEIEALEVRGSLFTTSSENRTPVM